MIVVVGAGVMGLATAWALSRRGEEVVVLEQFELGHRRGSSHGTSRIFRLSYPDAEWVALAQDAYVLWRELEAETGGRLLALHGLVDAVRDVDAHGAALTARGVSFDVLTGAEVGERFGLSYEPAARLLFQPDAGIARADGALAAFREAAVGHGATVRERTPVRALSLRDDAVAVATEDGELVARAVVVTAGSWAPGLVETLGVELSVTVTRETVAYFAVEDARAPVSVIDDLDDPRPGESFYALAAPGVGLKAGAHRAGPVADPDGEGLPEQRLVEEISAWVARRFPRADPQPLGAETCLYTNAPDERFIIERHGRVVVGSPCSGHGFKFAPAIGERLAALAVRAAAS